MHVRVAISQKAAVEFPKKIMMGKSVLKSSKTEVVRSHGHHSNAFCDTVQGSMSIRPGLIMGILPSMLHPKRDMWKL